MIGEPKCFIRHCEHYKGIVELDGTEETEENYCEAFPNGIPDNIAYGNNNHNKPIKDQKNKIIFEKGSFEWEIEIQEKKQFNGIVQKDIDEFIEKVLDGVKIKMFEQKEMNKEDWIRAWEDDPHWDKDKPSVLVKRLLKDYGEDPKNLYVLEIGCGNGVDSVAFGKEGCRVVGIDISPDAIKIANENNDLKNVKFQIGDAENLTFKDSQFDLVYSMAVLHSSDLTKSIFEIARVLKDAGEAMLFLYQKTLHDSGEKEIDFKYGEIEKIFKDNSFKIKEKKTGTTEDKDEEGKHTHYWVTYILKKE